MKIALISYSATDATVWTRLSSALNRKNVKCDVWAQVASHSNAHILKKQSRFSVFLKKNQRKIFNRLYPIKHNNEGLLFTPNLFLRSFRSLNISKVDIYHINWIGGLFDLKSLQKVDKPIVWTLHDVWPITGGCHCNLECDKWKNGCNYCEQIESSVSDLYYKKKLSDIQSLANLTVICPSLWLGNMVKASPIFKNKRVEIIPNCIDVDLFKPVDKFHFRTKNNIPIESKVIAFGAVNALNLKFKGFDLLVSALRILKKNNEKANLHLLVFGAEQNELLGEMPFPVTFLGLLNNEVSLMEAYNCADVFVGPSRQDNLPSTFIEAQACGIPTVGFKIGGIPEICIHKHTGYIAQPFDVDDLANGIEWVLNDRKRWDELSVNARNKVVSEYNMDIIARKHIELYNSILT